jgi:flagellar hook-associated protein 1 FlgK
MSANYTALQTTGNNIANAGVEGYSRQSVNLATSDGLSTASGYIGRGVSVQGVERAHDVFLTREAVATASASAMQTARLESLQRLEEVFTPGELGIGHAAGQFLNAMVDLANRPADDATRQVVLARAGEVADRFATASRQMDAIQDDVEAASGDAVKRINQLAQVLAQVNQRLAAAGDESRAPLDLLDERDRLIAQLAEKIETQVVPSKDGTVAVFVAGGKPLVMGSQSRSLSVVADPSDPRRVALGIQDGEIVRTIDSDDVGGGELAGLLSFQNQDLVRGRALLGQMASAFVGAVNAQQAAGVDLNGLPGEDLFFDFHQPAIAGVLPDGVLPMVIPAATNEGSATPVLTVVDPRKLQAEEYALLHEDGGWKLQSKFGGATIDATDVAKVAALGFEIDLSGLDTTNRFLLQPVTYAAGFMQRTLNVHSGIAAGITGQADNANARKFVELGEKLLVGQGSTITDAYASLMADIGVRTQGVRTSAEIARSMADQAEVRRASQAGVNLDEEAARMLQFQQAYQASAKVLQTAQTIFDTLLQASR